MVEPEKPLKRKDQILVDEEIAQIFQEELQAKLEKEERLVRQKEEEDNLISWNNTPGYDGGNYELAQRLQAEEQGELTIEETIDAIATSPLKSPIIMNLERSSKEERCDTIQSLEVEWLTVDLSTIFHQKYHSNKAAEAHIHGLVNQQGSSDWRNKHDLDTMSFDDLYNNFKIVEQEVKATASLSLSSSSQNMAFVSSPSISTASTQVSTANLSDDIVYAFLASQPNGSQLIYEDLEQIHEDDIEEMYLKWQLALLSMRTRRGPKNQDSRNRNQDSSRRTVNVEEISSKAIVAIDGAGFDWSYMADDEVPTNMALMAFSDSKFNKSKFNLATYKRGLASVEEQLVFYKKNEVIFYKQLAVLKRDISYKDSELIMLKRSLITDKSRKGVGFVSYNVVPPPPTGLFSPLNLDLSYSGLEEFQQPEFEGYGPKTSKSVSEDISNEVRESPNSPLVKELVSDDNLEKKTVFPTVAKI
ncbi:hypothetical protein Tco_0519253 [Tanacetum coccineum]